MASEPHLPGLQRWLQAIVVHPGTVEEAVVSPDVRRELPTGRVGDVILPSKTLTPVERVGVYQGMYLLRMRDALVTDYEALAHLLGDDAFFDLVRDYVQVHPSRSHSLNRLGDHLPEYIETASRLKRRAFCADLARLERAVAQVFDAPETPSLSSQAIDAVPSDAWEGARLKPIVAFRLLSFRYPVNAYLQSVLDGNHAHPKLTRADTRVVVYRRNYRVWRQDLTPSAHALLGDLAAGHSLGRAIAAALGRGTRGRPKADDLFGWFRQWVSGGLFGAVETP